MRILQIANGYFQSDLFEKLFAELYQQDVTSHIVVPVENGSKYDAIPSNVSAIPCFSQIDRMLFFRKQKKLLSRLEKMDIGQYDIIHAHTVFSGGYSAYQLHKKYNIPYIIAVRNTDVNVFFKYMLHLRNTGIEIMRHAEKIVFLSPAYRETVLSMYVPARYREIIKEKSVVIPNGISKLFFEQKAQAAKVLETDNSVRLIYVGEILANKNLELTIQAVNQLRQEGMDASITAVGPILEEKYQKLIEKTPFLTHYNRCPQDQVIQHLKQTDIFVMPSHAETFGLVYAEAMSQGLPVLYTRGQGFDGHFPEGSVGYSVSDTDAAELAEKIKQVISHYQELSANCIHFVDEFNWKSIAEKYKQIYQKMISRGK